MKVLDAEFVQGYIRMANDGWEQGWHERNGGNLTYRMKPEEDVVCWGGDMIIDRQLLNRVSGGEKASPRLRMDYDLQNS